MNDIPTVVSTAEIQVGSVTMRVHHLSDNQRVIDAESVAAFMAALADGSLLAADGDAMKLVQALVE